MIASMSPVLSVTCACREEVVGGPLQVLRERIDGTGVACGREFHQLPVLAWDVSLGELLEARRSTPSWR